MIVAFTYRLSLERTGDGDICVRSLTVNGNQLLVGKNKELQSFWIDGDYQACRESRDDLLSTTKIVMNNPFSMLSGKSTPPFSR